MAEEYIQRRLREAQTRQSLIQAGLVKARWIHRVNGGRIAIGRWITRQGRRLVIAPNVEDKHRARLAPPAWQGGDANVDENCCPVAA